MRRLLSTIAILLMCTMRALGQTAQPPAPTVTPPTTNGTASAAQADIAAEEAEIRSAIEGWSAPSKDEQGNSINEANPAVVAYRALEAALAEIDRWQSETARFEKLIAETPAQIEALRAERDQVSPDPKIEVPADATLAQLEQRMAEARAQLESYRQQVTELAAERGRRDARLEQIPRELADRRQQLDQVSRDIAASGTATPAAGEEPARGQRLLLLAQRLRLLQEIQALERERASYEARPERLAARRELATLRAAESEKISTLWEQAVNARRQTEADAARREAEALRKRAARQHPVLRDYAEQSAEIAQELDALQTPAGGTTVTQQIDAIDRRRESLRVKLVDLKRRVQSDDEFGIDDATGLALRREYASIGDLESVERDARDISKRARDIEYRRQEILLELDAIGDDNTALADMLGRVEQTSTPIENRDDLIEIARELITARRDILNKLDEQLSNRSTNLDRLKSAYTDRYTGLIGAMRESLEYLEERILWVRSVAGKPIPSGQDAADAARWLTDQSAWGASLRTSWSMIRYERLEFLSILSGLALLLIIRWRAPARLEHLAEKIGSFRTDHFVYTFRALVLTALMSWVLPALLRSIAWFLDRPAVPLHQAVASASGLRAAAGLLFVLIFARMVLRDGGLGDRHFSWHTAGVRTLRMHLRWFIPVITVLWALVIALDTQSVSEAYNDSLGRLCFIGAMIAMGVFLARVLRPSGPIIGPVIASHRDRWLGRLSKIWYSAAVGVPVLLIGLALARYYYSALRVQHLLFATLWLIGALVLASALTGRWLFIVRRRLAIESARRRREQARAAAAAEAEKSPAATQGASTSPPPPPPPPPAVDPSEVDIPALDSKMRQAVRTGVGLAFLIGMVMIWSEVLPALKMLDRVQLWPAPALLDEPETVPAQHAAIAREHTATETGPMLPGMAPITTSSQGGNEAEEPFRLTLGDLGLALLFGVITVLAVRNLPAVGELMLLEHLPLDAASRYALVSVFRYAIAIIGVTVTMGAMGISWSSIQWLAAALTFGLAFGLQEIFANFVSGLIILAERPIRVGDMVTVGDTDGTVGKIRMRATTIVGFDRKELIIPNKSFITDRVINWTLSDSIQRIVVPVGVAYGSDLDKVERTLMEVCKSVPAAMTDPAPMVLYKGFGDRTLNWEARIFVPTLDALVPSRTALYKAIDLAFRRAGIEIAFPQMDLHVRASDELRDLLQNGLLSKPTASGPRPPAAPQTPSAARGPEGA